jgi:hypothetical protein
MVLPETALVGGTFGGLRGLHGLAAEQRQVPVDETNGACFDVVVENLSPWPEGECAAEWSLEVGKLHDRDGGADRTKRVCVAGREAHADGLAPTANKCGYYQNDQRCHYHDPTAAHQDNEPSAPTTTVADRRPLSFSRCSPLSPSHVD